MACQPTGGLFHFLKLQNWSITQKDHSTFGQICSNSRSELLACVRACRWTSVRLMIFTEAMSSSTPLGQTAIHKNNPQPLQDGQHNSKWGLNQNQTSAQQ